MDNIHEVLGLSVPLDQAQLSFLSKSALKKALNSYNGSLPSRVLESIWDKLVQTCLDPIVGDKHLTASCNSLSVLLINAAASPDPQIRAFIFQERVWFEGYQCAWRALNDGKTKPALQVLETLLLLLAKHPDNIAALNIRRGSIASSVDTIITGHPRQDLKVCCIVLSCYLRKTELHAELETVVETSLNQVSSSWARYQHANNVYPDTGSTQSSAIAVLLLALLFAVRNLETRSASLKAIVQTCSGKGAETCTALAAEVFQIFIRANSDSLGEFADSILPVVLDDRERYETFLKVYQIEWGCTTEQMLLYLSVLRIGRLKRFVDETELPTMLNEAFIHAGIMSHDNTEPNSAFEWLLKTGNTALRLHVYDLLTISSATHTAVSPRTLEYTKKTLGYLHNENDAYERGELLAITRRLMNRVQNGRPGLLTSQDPAHSASEAGGDLRVLSDFRARLVQFLTAELGPGVSYSRHITALQTLQLIPDVSIDVRVNGHALIGSLLSLILDPFNDVRELSAHLVHRLTTKEVSAEAGLSLPLLCEHLGSLSARSGRQDHADAAGRLGAAIIPGIGAEGGAETTGRQGQGADDTIQLLASRLSVMEELTPGTPFPLHGTILTLVHYFNDLDVGCARAGGLDFGSVIKACQRLWALVQSVLCVDSPERGTEQECDDTSEGPKDLLAYSWRALRDTSLLLQGLLRHDAKNHGTVHDIGELCLDQLIKLRHRGAFSTVAQTFAMSCERARASADASVRALVGRWYHVALEQIEIQSQQLTRRSAGLPAMFNAILSASDPSFLRSAVEQLIHEASLPIPIHDRTQGSSSLPQVHALNCLKDIMTNSKFRAVSEQHVSVMLEVAATSLICPIWAIRNCGLMLMRACMTRMSTAGILTGDGNGTTKGPVDVATNLLDQASPQSTAIQTDEKSQHTGTRDPDLVSESIFAALELVRHTEQGRQQNARLRDLIELQLGNRIWAIRDHAARVLADLLSNEDEPVNLRLISSRVHHASQNETHGQLLLLRYRLAAAWKHTGIADEDLARQTMISILDQVYLSTLSPYTHAALLDIINDCFLHHLDIDQSTHDLPSSALAVSFIQLCQDSHSTYCQDRLLLCRTLLHLTTLPLSVVVEMDLQSDLFEVLATNPDSAIYVLRSLAKSMSQLWGRDLRRFICRLIVRVHTSDVRALAMTVLVDILEITGTRLDETSVREMGPIMDLNKINDRSLQDATLRLQSHMFRRALEADQRGPNAVSLAVVRRWSHVLQTASHDYLEFSTRLNATRALRCCVSSLMDILVSSSSQEGRDAQVDLISILYDQLNDDDEDIRSIAQETAYYVMGNAASKRQWALPLSSLAARRQLVGLLAVRNCEDLRLVRLCLLHLAGNSLGEVLPSQVTVNMIFGVSVAERLEVICSSMDDLFAEERQNLYVDELEEIEVWSELLHRCRFSTLPQRWMQVILSWTSNGLDVVMTVVESGKEQTKQTGMLASKLSQAHPLGPTYHQDILELCLRVIKLAQVLCQAPRHVESSGAGDERCEAQTTMKRTLKTLKAEARDTRLHHKVVQALAGIATE